MAVIKVANTKAETSDNLDYLQALPNPGDVFVCRDSRCMDFYGEFITDVHIQIKRDAYDRKIRFCCFGKVKDIDICFDAAETLEGACKIIDGLEPYYTEADHDPEEDCEEQNYVYRLT